MEGERSGAKMGSRPSSVAGEHPCRGAASMGVKQPKHSGRGTRVGWQDSNGMKKESVWRVGSEQAVRAPIR